MNDTTRTVRLSVDCMGGDHGPSVTLPACRSFLDRHPDAELVLVGTEQALAPAAGWARCRMVIASEVVEMDDPVEVALRKKRDSSMRVAIQQVMGVDSTMEDLIARGATSIDIDKAAKEQGMTTLRKDGWQKALQGITSVEEVLRVTV
mgnify:CR=1 FL=1